MIGVEQRWKGRLMLSMLEIRGFTFVHNPVNKSLENQAREKASTGVAQAVQWHQDHGVDT